LGGKNLTIEARETEVKIHVKIVEGWGVKNHGSDGWCAKREWGPGNGKAQLDKIRLKEKQK